MSCLSAGVIFIGLLKDALVMFRVIGTVFVCVVK